MINTGNSVDDNVSKKIIDTLSRLDQNTIDKLAKDSGIPIRRLHHLIENTEPLTALDKGRLIPYLINLTGHSDKQE